MSRSYFIDTNILMYAVGSEHPLKRPCLAVVRQVSEGRIQAVTDTEVFQEIAHRYWSQRRWPLAIEIFRDFKLLFSDIYAVEKQHLSPYYQLLSDYPSLSPRDAIHVSVMQSHQVSHIYTADKDFKTVPWLKWMPLPETL